MGATAPSRPQSILIWHAGALGDTLLAYPALASLRAWAPDATITVIGHPAYLHPAHRAHLIDAVLDVDSPQATAFFTGQSLPAAVSPDLVVLWSAAYQRLADICVVLGIPSVIAAPPRAPDARHQSRYLLDCLRPLGVPRPLKPAPVPPLDPASVLSLPDGFDRRPLVLLHPGAGTRWKRWPLPLMRELAARLEQSGATINWSCGPADTDLREALDREYPGPTSGATALHGDAVSPSGTLWPYLPLATYAARLARCALLVSPDTGVAHLAALLGVPQVALFGPTDWRRWRPLSRLARIIHAPSSCAGTWQVTTDGAVTDLSLRRCPPGAGSRCSCLEALPLQPVLSACRALLAAAHNSAPALAQGQGTTHSSDR